MSGGTCQRAAAAWRGARATREGRLCAALALLGGVAAGCALGQVPVSTRPPGKLAPSETPQLVLLSFDDAVNTAAFAYAQLVMTNLFNPNGQPIKATFFVTLNNNYDPSLMRRLYDAGNELALHTMSHTTDEYASLVRWRQEIAGERHMLARLCDIPAEAVVGFRAPYLKPNDASFRALHERGFLYDSTISEYLSRLSTAPTNMIWPYTLHEGLQQNAQSEYLPTTNYPGLFEIPLWPQFTNGSPVFLMSPDERMTSNEVVAIWKENFLAHYENNRAPFGLYMHISTANQWLSNPSNTSWRVGALREVIGWMLARPDTWLVTYRDLAEYMLCPVPAWAAATNPVFQTQARTPFPPGQVSACLYPGSHTVYVCGECPPAAPAYTNAYLDWVPFEGGTMAVGILSQSVNYAWCELTVSNDTAASLNDWAVLFTVTGGTVQWLYDAAWEQTGDQLYAEAKPYNRQIAAGAARVFAFRVVRNGETVSFPEGAVSALGLGPQPFSAALQPVAEPPGWRLTWDDRAHVYAVETSTNLLQPEAWVSVTNELCLPVFTAPPLDDNLPHFYRVKGTLY